MDVRVGLWRILSTKELVFLNCVVGEDSWESLGLQGDPTNPSYRRTVLGVHWKDWCWSRNSNILATWCEELTHLKRPWCWERLKAGGEGDETTEDEMVGWHHRLNGYGFEYTLGVGDGQGGLVCCSPWGCKELDTTERLNWTEQSVSCEMPGWMNQSWNQDCLLKYHFAEKAMVFPVVIYGCQSWPIMKAERRKTDAFELWCWRRLFRVPWTVRRTNQSILKEINPEYSLEGLMLKLQYAGHLMWRADSLEKSLMLGKIEGMRKKGRQRMRWLDGISNSMDICVISRSVVSNSCNPMGCSPPGSSVHGISQAWILEWVAMLSSRGSSQPRDWTQVSRIAGEPNSPTLQLSYQVSPSGHEFEQTLGDSEGQGSLACCSP